MRAITLRNFRSLKDTESVSIAPITVLLGQNSSGKSTFLRSLALLKQSVGVRAREPFLWVGELVDFGGFSETLSTFADRSEVVFEYEIETPLFDYLSRVSMVSQSNRVKQSIKIRITEKAEAASQQKEIFEYRFELQDELIEFSLSSNGDFTVFKINGRDYTKLVKNWLTVHVWRGPIPAFARFAQPEGYENRTFKTLLDEFIKARTHHRTGEERRGELSYRVLSISLARFLEGIKRSKDADSKWSKFVISWTADSPDYKELRALVVGVHFLESMSHLAEYTASVLENIKYITPLRANAERYYRKQGLAVDELDPKGTNFALFLHNMPPFERKAFSKWSEEFFGVSIAVTESAGHLSLFIHPQGSDGTDNDVNIADTGFGFSQMFPILAQLWAAQRPSRARNRKHSPPILFAIEQPELHLHPRLQAKLADVFVNAVNAAKQLDLDLRIIVETHSEYLVNRLGLLIAKKNFPSGDASVLIFEREKFTEPTMVRRAFYTEKGYLENWPFGFFEPQL